jgi:lipoate---protein ligase
MHQNATCRPGRHLPAIARSATVEAPLQESAALDACPELAGDQTLFDEVEAGRAHGLYRLWQATQPIVVAGRHRPLTDDVHVDACCADDVPIVRRASGGGTVVIGAGCLNYAVVLSLVSRPALMDVGYSFELILDTIVGALAVPGLERRGTDVSLLGRKVSGNAQRRGRRALLHHGTLLFDFDSSLTTRYLREPARQPAYRAGRPHEEFLTNIPLPLALLRSRLEEGLRLL